MILDITKHLLTFVLTIPLVLLGLILLPFVLLFIDRDTEHLPINFIWFDNYDYYDNESAPEDIDGLAGPDYYRKPRGIYPYGEFKFFRNLWHRYHWLALRNPINYFKNDVLGLKISHQEETTITEVGNPLINVGKDDPRGLYYARLYVYRGLRNRPEIYTHIFYIKEYSLLGKQLLFRFRCGNKFTRKHLTEARYHGTIRPWTFTITPAKQL